MLILAVWPDSESTSRSWPPEPPRAITFRAKRLASPLTAHTLIAVASLLVAIAVTLRKLRTTLAQLAQGGRATPATPGSPDATAVLLRIMPLTTTAAWWDPLAMGWSTEDCEAYTAGHSFARS